MRHPLRSFSACVLIACAAALSSQPQQRRDVLTTRGVVQAADADGSGDVGQEEWSSFLRRIGADDAGQETFDRYVLKAEVLGLDLDGDGVVTSADVATALDRSDAAARRRGGWLGSILLAIGDADQSGALEDNERQAFLAEAGEGPLEPNLVRTWLERAESLPPPTDRNAITPGIVLVGMDALFDADANGQVTASDVRQIFSTLDADANGTVSTAELAPPQTFGGNWGVSREERARPPLMPWQRTLEDALALVEATGKPLLICVNIDGEAASDNLAYGRYRDPEFVRLAEGFVCVLASPDQREPRARDDRGRRLADRRFGRLLNSEHIDIEPALYERYFNGNRVAPRHVGVSPDGEILFDLYLLQNLSAVDEKLRQYGMPEAQRVVWRDPATLSENELLESPDALHREELEKRFVDADERTRTRLASLALSSVRATQHAELLRLALRDPLASVRKEAAWTLVRHPEGLVDELITLVWDVARQHAELQAPFAGALQRAEAGTTDETQVAFLRRTRAALRALESKQGTARWQALTAALLPGGWVEDVDRAGRALETIEKALDGREEDARLWSRLALARMNLARIALRDGGNPSFFCQDALDACDRALALAPTDGLALGAKAWASYLLSDLETAGALAGQALAHLDEHAASALTAEVARVRAQVATRGVYQAQQAKQDLDATVLGNALEAYELLAVHPRGTSSDAQAHLQLLGSVGAYPLQLPWARRALGRFPGESELHNWLRFLLLRDAGAEALEATYASELDGARASNPAMFAWYQGVASLAAAERRVEDRLPGAARESYARSIAHFEASVAGEPSFASSAAHYQVLALAGAARLHVEAEELDVALELVLRAAALAPESYDAKDGLDKSLRDTARALRSALRRTEGDVERLEQGLAELGLSAKSLSGRG